MLSRPALRTQFRIPVPISSGNETKGTSKTILLSFDRLRPDTTAVGQIALGLFWSGSPFSMTMRLANCHDSDFRSLFDNTIAAVRNMFLTTAFFVCDGWAVLEWTMMFLLLDVLLAQVWLCLPIPRFVLLS
ncbi:unnamed protein product [Nippostrongylus brasiliensis]|uniref:Uncharacterized protein n=1 Tax=Nippostrongylus brasiliensis TaxID=27835 RepID=A0A0N4YM06_NIPBR|nr:unnamed protein product [Nippostrongylus brasiliensis]